MCKGSQTTSSTSAPNPQAMAAYTDLLGRAAGVASTPFTPYGGEFVAPLNAQQNQAGANINANAGFAQPYIQQGAQYATAAAQPISPAQIAQYQSPFTQQVVNATQAQFNNQNQQQLENVRGNAVAQGALGGDREAVGEANLSNQQNLSQAPVIAGLYNQGYNTALSTALQEQQNLGQSAYSLGNLGVAGQNAALSGANAQLGFGTLGQSTQQGLDQALYNQFLAQQGFPFQEAQWQAGIDTAVGSQMGGTSSTTGPPPNQTGQFLGLGLAGLSLLNRGGGVRGRAHGGKIPGFAIGGMPYDGGSSYIPSINLTQGQGAPKAPGLPGQQQPDPFKLASSTMDLEKKIKGLGGSSSFGGFNYGDPDLASAAQAGVEDGLSFDPLSGDVFARGGKVRGFAGGGLADDAGLGDIGDSSFDDRFNGIIYDPRADRAERAAAMDARRPGDQPGPGLGLGDIVSSYAPGFQNNYGYDFGGAGAGASAAPAGAPIDVPGVVHAPSDDGRLYNLTDDENAPGVPREALSSGLAPPLPGAVDVADTRPPGLDAAAMSYAPEAASSNPVRGYAPVPGSQGVPAIPAHDQGENHGGFGFLDKLGIHMDPNVRKAMLTAGFAMMASRSPFLGNAIGEGGLAGINAYSGAQKADLEKEKTQASIETARKQLEQHADEFQKKLALDTKKLQQQEELGTKRLEVGKFTPVPGLGVDPNDATGKQVPGTYVFNTRTGQSVFRPNMVQTAKPRPDAAAALPAEAWNTHGDEFLKYLPPEKQGVVKGIADYTIDPKSMSVTGGHREEYMNLAKQFDPDFDQKTYNQRYNAVNRFASGTQGQNLTSLNTTMYHLDTLEKAVDALNNGNVQAFNQVGNFISRQFGYPNVTNFEGVRDIAADEVVKSVLGSAGSDDDRRSMRQSILAAGSPAQLHGIIEKYQEMMAGRLHSLRYQYETSTGLKNFDEHLTPETRQRLGRLEAGVGQSGGGAAVVPPANQRQIGQVYQTPKGPFRWNGSGWDHP